jgi:glycosyltransferase involved in cell wall biosynthesis
MDLDQYKADGGFPEEPTVVSVGSLFSSKRWDRLLTACAEMHRRGRRFRLLMVGDGPLHAELGRLARSLGIADRVEFLGERRDVPQLISAASFLAHTSDCEGCPNVVMEAMACARPVLATDAGDIPDLIEDGKSGFVVRRGDDAALAQRLETLLDHPTLWPPMGQAGRSKAEREFGLARMAKEMLAAYEEEGWSVRTPT